MSMSVNAGAPDAPLPLSRATARPGSVLPPHLADGTDPHRIAALVDRMLAARLPGKADLVGGKVPSDQLPSYVDDVLEFSSRSSFPADGDAGKIYVATDTDKTYRWSGTQYVEVGGGDIPAATTEAPGLMSAADKAKLDGVAAGAQANVIESVKVNGAAVVPSGKSVDVPPTSPSGLAADYSASSAYAVGDLCVYGAQLYRCKATISAPEQWISAHWEATTPKAVLTPAPGDRSAKFATTEFVGREVAWPAVTPNGRVSGTIFQLVDRAVNKVSLSDIAVEPGEWMWFNGDSELSFPAGTDAPQPIWDEDWMFPPDEESTIESALSLPSTVSVDSIMFNGEYDEDESGNPVLEWTIVYDMESQDCQFSAPSISSGDWHTTASYGGQTRSFTLSYEENEEGDPFFVYVYDDGELPGGATYSLSVVHNGDDHIEVPYEAAFVDGVFSEEALYTAAVSSKTYRVVPYADGEEESGHASGWLYTYQGDGSQAITGVRFPPPRADGRLRDFKLVFLDYSDDPNVEDPARPSDFRFWSSGSQEDYPFASNGVMPSLFPSGENEVRVFHFTEITSARDILVRVSDVSPADLSEGPDPEE